MLDSLVTWPVRTLARNLCFLWNWIAPGVTIYLGIQGHYGRAAGCLASAHLPILISTFIPACGVFGKVIQRFRSLSDKEVWLTIDDGPDPVDTPYLLDLLDAHQAKATFFFIGAKILQYPELAKAVLHRGHQIGNHTQHHPEKTFWAASRTQIRSEIEACETAIASLGHPVTPLFRAPAGFKNPWVQAYLEKRHIPLLGWQCRGYDGVWKDPEAILKALYQDLEAGAIVLIHEGKMDHHGNRLCPQVAGPLFEELNRRGLRCVLPEADSWL